MKGARKGVPARPARALLPAGLAVAVLAACGSQGALSQEVVDRARASGAAPDLIYAVELDGYRILEQSAGGVGDEGFGVLYAPEKGAGEPVELRVDRGSFDDDVCASTPVSGGDGRRAARCERDGDGWYRTDGVRQDYTVVRGDHYVRLAAAVGQVGREALRAAVTGARPAVGDGMPAPPPTVVPRGDLPTTGDGAPYNPVGPGG
ncbi:hypothetical protein [Nonomuraea roseoviolacea]|uniref:Uncharacterized protein n=1 Tax=Nonomuraea roseoviolacea subsp. carminata TaxID=160689 RepID=A0ABT1KAD5_9ACTN|nr:hypothetical protein [Nonomuraea roseoviolacea]MCP2350975.1 hypothetical protein [Nonomuraea roseoviolacea subsp. carminata]